MKMRPIFVLLIYFLLLVFAIPWYWPESSMMIIFGIPAWVLVSILLSLLVSIFTAYLLLTANWSIDDPFDE